MSINNPVPTTSIVDSNGLMNQNFRTWTQKVSREVGAGGGGGGAVDSVNGLTGVVLLTKTNIGLPNVDNTSDLLKPVSTANQTALDLKLDSGVTTSVISDSLNRRYVTDAQLAALGSSVYSFNRITGAGTQSLSGTGAVITWATSADSFGSDVAYSGSVPTRLTAVSAGAYKIGGYFAFFTTAARPQAAVMIYKNGSPLNSLLRSSSYVRNAGSAWDYWVMEISNTPLNLLAGDYIEIYMGQVTTGSYSFGGSATTTVHRNRSEIFLERLA